MEVKIEPEAECIRESIEDHSSHFDVRSMEPPEAAFSRKGCYPCDICHMRFSQKANMTRHRLRHTGKKPFGCPHCQKRFFRKDYLKDHLVNHMVSPLNQGWECPLCSLKFPTILALKGHVGIVHDREPGPKYCKGCGNTFSTGRRLLLHYQLTHLPVYASDSQLVVEANSHVVDAGIQETSGPTNSGYSASYVCDSMIQGSVSAPTWNHSPPILPGDQGSDGGNSPPDTQLLYPSTSAVSFDFTSGPTTPVVSSNSRIPSFASIDMVGGGMGSLAGERNPSNHHCAYCNIQFGDLTLYLMHKGAHAESNPWKCNLCGTQCADKYSFSAHLINSSHS